MKPKTIIKSSSIALLALAFAGTLLAPSASASDQQAFAKAAGKYTGTLSGGTEGISLPPTPTTIKMPKGKGKGKITITGFPSIKGKVTKASCRQGGKKVIQSGTGKVPESVTAGVIPGAGAITVPFKSTITLGSGKPKMKARVSVSLLGMSVTASFKGSQ